MSRKRDDRDIIGGKNGKNELNYNLYLEPKGVFYYKYKSPRISEKENRKSPLIIQNNLNINKKIF